MKRSPGGEPEPEIIKSSDTEDSIKKVSNFPPKDKTQQFSNQKQEGNRKEDDDMIDEELEESDDYSQKEFDEEEEDPEE